MIKVEYVIHVLLIKIQFKTKCEAVKVCLKLIILISYKSNLQKLRGKLNWQVEFDNVRRVQVLKYKKIKIPFH
jgi:hypothetical protein